MVDDVAKSTLADYIPVIRNVVTYGAGVATAIGVMKSADQTTLIDAITHISADIQDLVKYVGIVLGIAIPIWVHTSSSVINLIRSVKRKAPAVEIVAPPAIAAVTPAQSTADVAVVSKVSGQAI